MGPDTPEFFLTARNSVGTFRIAWSFYAAAMGSWTLFSPAQYAWTAGKPMLLCCIPNLATRAILMLQPAGQFSQTLELRPSLSGEDRPGVRLWNVQGGSVYCFTPWLQDFRS